MNDQYLPVSEIPSNELNITNLWAMSEYTISIIPLTDEGHTGASWTVNVETAQAGIYHFRFSLNL